MCVTPHSPSHTNRERRCSLRQCRCVGHARTCDGACTAASTRAATPPPQDSCRSRAHPRHDARVKSHRDKLHTPKSTHTHTITQSHNHSTRHALAASAASTAVPSLLRRSEPGVSDSLHRAPFAPSHAPTDMTKQKVPPMRRANWPVSRIRAPPRRPKLHRVNVSEGASTESKEILHHTHERQRERHGQTTKRN